VFAACAEGGGIPQGPRFPEHRRVEEQRISELEAQIKVLEARMIVLETTVRELRASSARDPR